MKKVAERVNKNNKIGYAVAHHCDRSVTDRDRRIIDRAKPHGILAALQPYLLPYTERKI